MIFMISSKPKFKYKRVKVIWQDIVTDPSWFEDLKDVDKLTYAWCEDTGYLYYKDKKMYILRNDSLDRFGTTLEKRFSKKQILKMMKNSGLKKVKFSDTAPFWCAIGFKK